MTPNRFQEAKRIYVAALDCEPAQRDAYLSEACEGDEALRTEVESLLGCRAEAQEFFKAPAIEAGAKALARESRIDFTGRTLSHYAILDRIGEGGMGVIYEARDTHLDRSVALKVLPPERVADPERRRRFVQEAKAASALNHPNIVVIHDIDTAGGVTFIAMELVRGRTLDRMIQGTGMPLKDTLRYGVQIADALEAAHRSGIIHRDIKPANIMITDSGLVKVLDFGLAKLTDRERGGFEGGCTPSQNTEEGTILGTVTYMSPEQAEGKAVDARSDIFSLGAVLYEMLTGRRAFCGETNVATLAAILHEEPRPVSQLATETPHEMEQVVFRCLRKDPERRFQQMADLKVALEELKGESDSGVLVAGAPRRQFRRRVVQALSASLLAVTLGLGAWIAFLGRPPAGPAPKVRTFTGFPGSETRPSFSPDGKQLAFIWNGEKQDNFDIYVQLVDEATPRRLTTNAAFDYSPVWSPDALHIAFLRDSPAGKEVIVIPAGGGAERKLHVALRNDYGRQIAALAWSPGGRFLSMVDKDSPQGSDSVFLLDIETRERRKLTAPPSDSWDGLPTFSPDGGSLAFIRGHSRPLSDIYVLRLSDSGQPRGEPRRITYDNNFIYGLDWTADGRSIVFSSARGGVWSIWRVSAFGGEPERLPLGGNNAFWPTVSRKGNRLAYSEGEADWNVWRVAAPGSVSAQGPAAAPIRVTRSPQVDQSPAFSPDGRMIAWASMHSGSHQIWVCNSDGTQPSQLTHLDPPGAAEPVWSPDGRQIAFHGYGRGLHNVHVIGTDGGPQRRLTTGDFNEELSGWSHDGNWIYFTSNRGRGNAIWKAPASGGSTVLIAQNGSWPVESSDGKYVFYSGPEASIWKVPASGGSTVLMARNGLWPVGAFDGKYLYYIGPEASIWRVPESGGESAEVLKTGKHASRTIAPAGIYVLDPYAKGGPGIELFPFNAGHSHAVRLPGKPEDFVKGYLSVSPDGRWILYVHVDRDEGDIMLVENFR
jgi:eukaryotic-like serine/threonine-protein kinase